MPSKPPSLRAKVRKVAPVPDRWGKRLSSAQRGYGREHRAIRAQVLAEEPLCRECTKRGLVRPTMIADHIKPLAEGGETVRSNYQGLCKRCHDAKTAREGQRHRT